MESILVIGGGAAGLAAAAAAARELRALGRADVRVVLAEADERVGRSILATGNGRCNFSNANVRASDYRNAAFVGAAFQSLRARAAGSRRADAASAPSGAAAAWSDVAADPVHCFFARAGLLWREESEGRLYPQANKATSVLDVLRGQAARLGVCEQARKQVRRVEAPRHPGAPFAVFFEDGSIAHPSAVVLAMGGKHLRSVELPERLAVAPMHPVLGPLRSDGRLTKPLNNIRLKCALRLYRPDVAAALRDVAADADLRRSALEAALACGDGAVSGAGRFLEDETGALLAFQRGELLFRDYGLSGIAVFNLSRYARPGDTVVVDALPDVSADDALPWMEGRLAALRSDAADSPVTGADWCAGMVLSQVGALILRQAGLAQDGEFRSGDIPSFAKAAKGLRFPVEGIADASQCQVQRGGFDVCAFDGRTMESKAVRGLFAAGELLDVDGPCGGYNLHWAWASGMLAGGGAARMLAGGRDA